MTVTGSHRDRNVLLSVVSVSAVLGAAEGVCRLLEWGEPPRPAPAYVTDWAAWNGDFYTIKSSAVGCG